jgi:hypothetical protein
MSNDDFEVELAKELQAALAAEDNDNYRETPELNVILKYFRRLKSRNILDYVARIHPLTGKLSAHLKVGCDTIEMGLVHAFIGRPEVIHTLESFMNKKVYILTTLGIHTYPTDIKHLVKETKRTAETNGNCTIILTHNPLIINEMQACDVTLLTLNQNGQLKATRMDHIANFADRIKGYALGELWLSYADGEKEEALLKGGPAV